MTIGTDAGGSNDFELLETGVGATLGGWGGAGQLIIRTSEITLRLDRVTRRLSGVAEMTHEGKRVEIVHARLLPPWMNWHLILRSEGSTAAVNIVGKGRAVTDALKRGGYEVSFRRTWFSEA
jgi:hypothetical protein